MHNKFMSSTTFRAVLLAVACGSFALVAGCSANDGGGEPATGVALTGAQASPNPVVPGGAFTLTWTSNGTCKVMGPGAPTGVVSSPVSLTAPTTAGNLDYTITCVGKDGTPTTVDVPVVVQGPQQPGASLSLTNAKADPNPVAPSKTFTISWTATDATGACTVTGPGSFSATGTGSVTVPAAPATSDVYQYTVSCPGPGGTATSVDVPVIVQGTATVPSVAFQASPSVVTIPAGSSTGAASTLLWSVPNGNACAISGTDPAGKTLPASDFTGLPQGASVSGSGDVSVPPSGTITTPVQSTAGTYKYQLACGSTSGVAEEPQFATVKVTQQTGPQTAATGNCAVTDIAAGNATPLINNASTVFTATAPASSGVCLGCSVSPNPPAPIVAPAAGASITGTAHSATVTIPAGLLSLQAVNGTLNTIPGLSALLGNTGLLGGLINPVENAVTTPLGQALGGLQSLEILGPVSYTPGQEVGFVVNPAQQLLAVGAVQFFSICPLNQAGAPIQNLCSENVAQPAGAQGGQASPVKLQALNLTGATASGSTPNVFYNYVPIAASTAVAPASAATVFGGLQLNVAGVANVNNQNKVFYGCVADPAPASASSTGN